MLMSGTNALPSYYPTCGTSGGEGTLASQSSPYNIAPVSIPNYLPSLPAGIATNQIALDNRLISAHPSSLYVNMPDSAKVMSGQIQDMQNLRNQSAMYAGLLNGASHFNNCMINIANNQPHQNPSMSELPFRVWQAPTSPQGVPVQVPVQTLVRSLGAQPAPFGGDARGVCSQMLDVCLTQLLQCQQNLAMLRSQMMAMGQPPAPLQSVQQNIQPFMVPIEQMMAHVQAAPVIAAGMPAAQMPALNTYSPQASVPVQPGPLGQYYFEPVLTGLPMSMPALTAACPKYHQMPMQSMPGWLPFASGFSHFSPSGDTAPPLTFKGAPLIYKPGFTQKQHEPLSKRKSTEKEIPLRAEEVLRDKDVPVHEPAVTEDFFRDATPVGEKSTGEDIPEITPSEATPTQEKSSPEATSSQKKPSPETTSSQTKSPSEATPTQAKSSPEATSSQKKPSPEATSSQTKSSSEATPTQAKSLPEETLSPENSSLEEISTQETSPVKPRDEEYSPRERGYQQWRSNLVKSCISGDITTFNTAMNARLDDYSLSDGLAELGGLTPLAYVAREGKYPELVTRLMDCKVDVSNSGSVQSTPLLIAAASRGEQSKAIVTKLLSTIPTGDGTELSEKAEVLLAAYKASRTENIIAVLANMESEDERNKCITTAGLKRGDFKGAIDFDTLLGVDPDGIKEEARELHETFIKACKACDHKVLKSNYSKLIKSWPQFDLQYNYEGKDTPLQNICASEGFVEDLVSAIGCMKQLILQQVAAADEDMDLEDSLPEYQERFKRRTFNERKLLTMALLAPSGEDIVQKVKDKPDRYLTIANRSNPKSKRYKNKADERVWLKNTDADWKSHLENWDKRELRLSNPELAEEGVKGSLMKYQAMALEQQAEDDLNNIQRDIRFLEKDRAPAKGRNWLKFPTKAKNAPATKVHETVKVKGREFQMMALLDPHSNKSKGLPELVSMYLKESLEKRLQERDVTSVIGIREALKLCLVDVNHRLTEFKDFDLTGLDVTLLLSFKNTKGETELWTVTLGDAVTALLHPDGRAERLSVETPDNRVLGYNILNVGTSARGKVTRRVLDKKENLAAITVCQFNGSVCKEAGLNAISELARRLEVPPMEKEHEGSKPASTIEDAIKKEKGKKKNTQPKRDKPASYTPKKVTMNDFVSAVMSGAGHDNENTPLLAQAMPLSGKRDILPPRILTAEGVQNRLRLLNINKDDRNRCEQGVRQLVLEIRSSPEMKNQQDLLFMLYTELLYFYGEDSLDLLPDGIVEEVKVNPDFQAMNNAKAPKEALDLLNKMGISTTDLTSPLAQLYRYRTVQLAEQQLKEEGLSEALESLYYLKASIDSCLDLRHSFPFLAPYLDSYSNTGSLLWQTAAEAWSSEVFKDLILDKLDKRLGPIRTAAELDVSQLAKQAGFDEITYRLMLARYKDQPLTSELESGAEQQALDIIKKYEALSPERLSKTVRKDQIEKTRQLIDEVNEYFGPQYDGDYSVSDLANKVAMQGIEFDTVCCLDQFDHRASFLELLIDSQTDADITELLELWENNKEGELLDSKDRFTYLIDKLESKLLEDDGDLDEEYRECIEARLEGLKALLSPPDLKSLTEPEEDEEDDEWFSAPASD